MSSNIDFPEAFRAEAEERVAGDQTPQGEPESAWELGGYQPPLAAQGGPASCEGDDPGSATPLMAADIGRWREKLLAVAGESVDPAMAILREAEALEVECRAVNAELGQEKSGRPKDAAEIKALLARSDALTEQISDIEDCLADVTATTLAGMLAQIMTFCAAWEEISALRDRIMVGIEAMIGMRQLLAAPAGAELWQRATADPGELRSQIRLLMEFERISIKGEIEVMLRTDPTRRFLYDKEACGKWIEEDLGMQMIAAALRSLDTITSVTTPLKGR